MKNLKIKGILLAAILLVSSVSFVNSMSRTEKVMGILYAGLVIFHGASVMAEEHERRTLSSIKHFLGLNEDQENRLRYLTNGKHRGAQAMASIALGSVGVIGAGVALLSRLIG